MIGPSAGTLGRALLIALVLGGSGHSGAEPASALTLEQAFARALALSEGVKLAGADVAAARLDQKQAWTLLGPQAFITGQGNEQRTIYNSSGAILQHPQQVIGQATLTQPLLRASFFPARRAAAAGLEQAQEAVALSKLQLHFDVARSFVLILRARRLVEVANANQERTAAQLKAATMRFSSGATLRTAVIQAQIDVYRAERQVVDAQQEADGQAATFERLVGIAPPALVPPAPLVPPELTEAIGRVAQRADVRAARAQLMQARSLVDVARGARWPWLDLQGLVSQAYPGLPLVPDGFTWRVDALLTIPLFQSGAEYVHIGLSRIDVLRDELRLALLEKMDLEQVRHAEVDYQARLRALTIAEQQVVQARDNYALVQRQFRAATATSTDVVVAQATLDEAESQQAVAGFDRDLAIYQLLFDVGTL